MQVLNVSAKRGDGMEAWLELLRSRREERRVGCSD
jgi:hypothetical protein